MFEQILVPTDGSEGAEAAAERGLELAATFDASVHALYVVEEVPASDAAPGSYIDAVEGRAARATGNIAERGTALDVDVIEERREGTPHEEILDYVETNDIDCIVMGTQGRTGLDRYLLGSVAEKVVRLSDVPVLIV